MSGLLAKGVRVELRLTHTTETSAQYEARVIPPQGEAATATIDVDADGAAFLVPLPDAHADVASFALGLARSARPGRSEGDTWPRRITRWRRTGT